MLADGEYTVSRRGNILLCRFCGICSEVEASAFLRDMQREVQQMPLRPWCRVFDMSQYQLHTPAVVAVMAPFWAWAAANGCLCHAFVRPNAILEQQIERAIVPDELPQLRIFSDEDTAIRYCERLLERYQGLSPGALAPV